MKTKRFFAGILITILSLGNTYCQTSIGFHTAFLSSNTNFEGVSEQIKPHISPIKTISFGISTSIDLDPNLALMTGANYMRKGFKTGVETEINIGEFEVPLGVKAVNTMTYIDVPMLLKYKVPGIAGIRPYLALGPSVGYALNGYLKTQGTAFIDFTINKTELPLDSETFNRVEWNANVLGGLEFKYRKGFIITELAYQQALNSFMTDASIVDLQAKHKGIQFKIGYGFRF